MRDSDERKYIDYSLEILSLIKEENNDFEVTNAINIINERLLQHAIGKYYDPMQERNVDYLTFSYKLKVTNQYLSIFKLMFPEDQELISSIDVILKFVNNKIMEERGNSR